MSNEQLLCHSQTQSLGIKTGGFLLSAFPATKRSISIFSNWLHRHKVFNEFQYEVTFGFVGRVVYCFFVFLNNVKKILNVPEALSETSG